MISLQAKTETLRLSSPQRTNGQVICGLNKKANIKQPSPLPAPQLCLSHVWNTASEEDRHQAGSPG